AVIPECFYRESSSFIKPRVKGQSDGGTGFPIKTLGNDGFKTVMRAYLSDSASTIRDGVASPFFKGGNRARQFWL
ncbi:MAG: hypothetical protein KKG92_03010, partial [Gammaproteobacteria bacterium]|nr:hypothetical protein [Gammaproteobacteria bacterium]